MQKMHPKEGEGQVLELPTDRLQASRRPQQDSYFSYNLKKFSLSL